MRHLVKVHGSTRRAKRGDRQVESELELFNVDRHMPVIHCRDNGDLVNVRGEGGVEVVGSLWLVLFEFGLSL